MLNANDELIAELNEIVYEAQKQVDANLAADQVVVVKTAKSNTYSFSNNVLDGKYDDENRFVQMLVDADDTEIRCIVCMWNNGGVEIPSINFRKRLLEVCPKNAESIYVAQGENGLIAKELKMSM